MSDAQEHFAARSRYPAPRPIVAAHHLRTNPSKPNNPVLYLLKPASFVDLHNRFITERAGHLRSGYTY